MPRGAKSSKEGLGFSHRSNLQNLMAAISTGISKLISLQGSLVQPLSRFHISGSTPLATTCKGEATHHCISSLAAARPVPTASLSRSHLWEQAPPVKHPHDIAAIGSRGFDYSQGKPRDQTQHKISAGKPSAPACPCPASSRCPSLVRFSASFTAGQENKSGPALPRDATRAQQPLSEA